MDTIKVDKQDPIEADAIVVDEELENKIMDDKVNEKIKHLDSSMSLSSSELLPADSNYETPVPPEVSNKDLIETLKPVFDDYNRKYGTSLAYDDLKSFINFAAFAKQSDTAIKEVINSKLITDACDYVIFKGIMVAAKVIDSQLNAIQSTDYTNTLSVEAITVITSIFDWMQKLEEFRKKYKQSNIEGKIANIIKDKKKSNRESSVDDLKLIDLLRLSLSGGKDGK